MSNKKNGTDIEREDYEDDYSELDFLGYGMDKDDALDSFLPYRVIDTAKFKDMDMIVVMIGADDPNDLVPDAVRDFAKEKAEFKMNARSQLIDESDVILQGQSMLSLRLFTFRKYSRDY